MILDVLIERRANAFGLCLDGIASGADPRDSPLSRVCVLRGQGNGLGRYKHKNLSQYRADRSVHPG